MAVLATDDKVLATELWGDDKYWDEGLGQYVPNGGKYDRRVKKGGEQPSAGNSTPASSDSAKTTDTPVSKVLPSTAPTTAQPSTPAPTASVTAPSTAGSGKASQ